MPNAVASMEGVSECTRRRSTISSGTSHQSISAVAIRKTSCRRTGSRRGSSREPPRCSDTIEPPRSRRAFPTDPALTGPVGVDSTRRVKLSSALTQAPALSALPFVRSEASIPTVRSAIPLRIAVPSRSGGQDTHLRSDPHPPSRLDSPWSTTMPSQESNQSGPKGRVEIRH